MNAVFKGRLPWALSFSFARALQESALGIWHGDKGNATAAQKSLRHRARCDQAARRGEYIAQMEIEEPRP
jgi:fructose-bisphosphate aldolase class I